VPQAQATLAALGHFRRLLASFLHYFACPNYRKVALSAPPHSNFRSKFKKVNTLLPRYHVKLPTFERAQLDCDRGGRGFGSKSASGLALNFPATEPEGVGGNEAHVTAGDGSGRGASNPEASDRDDASDSSAGRSTKQQHSIAMHCCHEH
jgi:hypothetical protein